MAETSTIARPYAQAVFKLAKSGGDLAKWSDMLDYAAVVAGDQRVAELFNNPRVRDEELVKLFLDICGSNLDDQGANLIRLLAENRRLGLLPEIAVQYGEMRAKEEDTLQAQLITARPVDDAVQKQLADALGKRTGRKVTLSAETDESLLGGAVIRAGDLVIDGSVRGRLERLAHTLNR